MDIITYPCPHLNALRDVIQEGGHGFDGMVTEMLELNNQLLLEFVVDDGHIERARLIGQEVAVVCALKMQFQIWKKNNEMQVLGLSSVMCG